MQGNSNTCCYGNSKRNCCHECCPGWGTIASILDAPRHITIVVCNDIITGCKDDQPEALHAEFADYPVPVPGLEQKPLLNLNDGRRAPDWDEFTDQAAISILQGRPNQR